MNARKSMKAYSNNTFIHYRTFNTNDKISFIIAIAVLLVIIGGPAYYLGTRTAKSPLSVKEHKITISPGEEPLIPKNWKKHMGELYGLQYPQDWIVKETYDDYFGNQITVSNPTETVALRILTGQQPFGYSGPQDIKTNDISIKIEGKMYKAPEVIVNNRQVYVNYTFKKGEMAYQILFGTGYPVASDDLASLSDYNKIKDVLIQILSTLTIKSK